MNIYRYPNITGATDAAQLQQLKNYLYTLVEQLNNTASAALPPTGAAVSGEAATPAETFASVKSLIIKSADIVDAYCDKLEKKLSGAYVAQSEFGDYVRKTDATLTATATGLDQRYTHLEQVVAGLRSGQQETAGYIRTGLLYYAGAEDGLPEGTPVYGVEVGQQNGGDFCRFGRFTAYGMTFFDENGIPAAQINRGQLKIGHGVVAASLTIGGFFDRVQPDGSLVTRWQGI